jgi:hypothetical protein
MGRQATGTGGFLQRVCWSIGALACLTLILTACQDHPSATPHRSQAATPSVVPSGPAPVGNGDATQCQADQLTVTLGAAGSNSGNYFNVFILTNTAAAPCTLDGYPGLLRLDAAGHSMPTRISHGADYIFPAVPLRLVTLGHEQTASFDTGYSGVSSTGGECPDSTSLQIIPPNDYGHLVVKVALGPCDDGLLNSSPVLAGSGGVPRD